MFQIGESLRDARTRRGFTPAEVHKAIRIRERYLTALEEERWDMLPGDAYTKGFLRTYAEFLGLNGQLYIDEYNARVAVHDEEPFVPEAIKQSGHTTGILFRTIGAVILVGAAIGGVVFWRNADNPARPTIDAAAAAPAPAARAHPAVAQAAAAGPAAKPVAAPKPTFTVIRAVRDHSWLSVRLGGPAGREIFRGMLEPGHFLKYGLRRKIWVRIGRPRALDIRIGKTIVDGLPDAPVNVVLTRNGATR